jgi:hypothetical protein
MDRLVELRMEAGLSRKELAARAGLHSEAGLLDRRHLSPERINRGRPRLGHYTSGFACVRLILTNWNQQFVSPSV